MICLQTQLRWLMERELNWDQQLAAPLVVMVMVHNQGQETPESRWAELKSHVFPSAQS